MPRKRATNQDALLTKNVIVRITETTFNKLEKMQVESGSASVADVVRRILSNRKIKLLHQDNSLNAPMEELALIRKELKAIGININQITRTFNQDKAETHRAFYVMKVADLYKNVDERVDKLLVIISQLAETWLQK